MTEKKTSKASKSSKTSKANKTNKKMGFQTEVSQLLHLVTHSLYSNKEIFLRELISNSSDAIDKLKFLALSDSSLYGDDGELKIQISFDKDNKTLTISDNGVGMTEKELVDNLGTIAKSGTKEFFGKLSGDKSKDSELIGQFGVGFYSSFIVADKVVVETLKAGKKKAFRWTSDGLSDFEIETIKRENRGTTITLHLKEDCLDFLERWQLNQIIVKYSDHISTCVELWQEPVAEEQDKDGKITVEAVAGKFVQINKAKALWTRSKSDIKKEDYQEFYKHISHDYQEAAAWSHNQVEGNLEYTTLLYIPKKAPMDMFQMESKHGLKLFVQRVFIMDEAQQFLPNYMRFVKGVIDSNDLPLNVSRELLQDNKITQTLKKTCTKRVLTMLDKLSKDEAKYKEFYAEFGNALKEGTAEDFANKDKITNLLRFTSTSTKDGELTSLNDYISRMKKGQDKIYYLVADSEISAKNSPHLEIFKKNGVEVILMWDRIDEWMMGNLFNFEEKTFESINKTDISGDLFSNKETEKDKKKDEENEKSFAQIISKIKEILADKVTEVRASKRLTQTPSCVVLEANAMSAQMLQLMRASGQEVPEQKYIFELNLEHKLIENLKLLKGEELSDWVKVLFNQAVLAEQGSVENSPEFIATLNKILGKSLPM